MTKCRVKFATALFKIITSIMCAVCLCIPGILSADEPLKLNWMDFEAGYEKAKEEGKMILVDAYTDWCGFCKKMDASTFQDEKVVEIMQTHFVSIKFNPEINKTYVLNGDTFESMELAKAIAKSNNVGFPSVFIYVPSAKTWLKQEGFVPPRPFESYLSEVVKYNQFLLENNKDSEEER